MREHAPQLYADLKRAGDLERTIADGARAASADLAGMIEEDDLAGDPAGVQSARELVLFRLLSTLDQHVRPDRRPAPEGQAQWEAMLTGQRVVPVADGEDPVPAHPPPLDISTRPGRRGFGVAAGALAGTTLVAGAWLAPRQTAALITTLYGPLTSAAELAIAISLFVLAPMAFVAPLKAIAAHGLRYACWVFAAALWATAWATAYLHFGRGAATIGMVLMGGPILPMGLIAAANARDWWTALSLVVLFAGWLMAWIASATMAHQAELRDVRASMLREAG